MQRIFSIENIIASDGWPEILNYIHVRQLITYIAHRTWGHSVHDAMDQFWNISCVNSQHQHETIQQFVTNIEHPQHNAINCLFRYQFCDQRISKCEQQYIGPTNKYERWMNGNRVEPLNIVYVCDIPYLVCGHSHFFQCQSLARAPIWLWIVSDWRFSTRRKPLACWMVASDITSSNGCYISARFNDDICHEDLKHQTTNNNRLFPFFRKKKWLLWLPPWTLFHRCNRSVILQMYLFHFSFH